MQDVSRFRWWPRCSRSAPARPCAPTASTTSSPRRWRSSTSPACRSRSSATARSCKTQGYGLANLELGTPATAETVFQIGSVSKQFIAAAVVLLSEDGKLSLDDPVTKYFGDAPDAWKGITVRHLLTHTSGLVRDTPDAQMKSQTVIEAIRGAYATPLAFAPGEKLQYSNMGYFALAEIITQAARKPWPQFCEERIFAPLGMTSTRTTTNDDLIPRRADGYVWREGRFINALNPAGVRPSGAFLSTAQDLARWDQALRTDRLFTAKQRELLWTPVTVNDGSTQPYGFGWEISKVGDHRLVRHGGSMFGFRSELSRYVDDGLTVVVLTNSGVSVPEKIAGGISASLIEGLQPVRQPREAAGGGARRLHGPLQIGERWRSPRRTPGRPAVGQRRARAAEDGDGRADA